MLLVGVGALDDVAELVEELALMMEVLTGVEPSNARDSPGQS